jgi:hypothetical protein
MPANAALLPKEIELAKLEGQLNRSKLWRLLKAVGALLAASVAASTAITGATETSTAFSTSYTVPANTLEAGTVLRGSAWGKHTATTSTETHTLALKLGSTAIATSGNLDPANDDYFRWEWEITCRTAGASGTIVGWARLSYGASGAAGTVILFYLDSTAFDTTADAVLAVYIDRQGSATDGDSARLDSFITIGHG